MKHKLIRITTVPISLLVLLKNQLKFMSNHFNVLAISSGGDILERVKIETSVNIREVKMTRKITPFSDLVALFKLIMLLREEKPTIVHTHTPKAGLLGMIASKIANVPIRLHTIAGLPLLEKKGLTKWILLKTEKITCACATAIYPNSFGMKQIILNHNFCAENKLRVIGEGSTSGVDTEHFSAGSISIDELCDLKNKLNISADNFVYGFIGRIVGDKGINELVTAFCNLYNTNKKLVLLLVGPFESELDPLDEEVVSLIKNHQGIRWVDFVKDVRPYFLISNVFVFPSYREGFPNVVMQAGAMNLPCIVSDINGCNEIIINNKNGLIIPVKNIPFLQNSMSYLFHNPLVCKEMSVLSRVLIKGRYESEKVISEIFKEYNYQIESCITANAN